MASLDHLRQQGYIAVPSLLSREQIDRIKAELAPYLRGTLRGRNNCEGFDTPSHRARPDDSGR